MNRTAITGFVLGFASLVTAQFLRVVGVHWWGFALVVCEMVTALACASVGVFQVVRDRARLPRCDHCRRPLRDSLLTVTLPTGVTRYHLDRACADAAPPEREPAFPGGRGCEPDCCPICGMDDPMGLEPCWGGQKAHQDCADWLGELPPVPELPPLHVDPLLIGSMYKPQPPPGPGAATTAR